MKGINRSRKYLFSITIMIVIGLILVGCSPQAAQPESAQEPTSQGGISQAEPTESMPEEEKVLTICLGGETTSLNKNIGQGGGGALGITIYEALFNNLVQPDPETGEVIPELATEWKVMDDHLTWQFTLREGVKFHNGTELTANDVKVTLDDVINSETAVSNVKRRVANIDRVEVVDDHTVNIVTKEPFVTLPISVGDAAIYPADYYLEVGEDGFSEDPIGSGQFMFEEWVKGTSITLVKNPDYFGPQTNVDRVIFRPFPETGARIAALENGECDIASAIPPDDTERLENAGFNVLWSPLGQTMLVQLVPVPGTPLEDVRVRQALNYAVDKASLVENVMQGFGTIIDGQLVGSDGFGYNPDLEPYPYDPDKARELLTEAGYPDGFSIDFQCSEGRYVKQREVCEALVGQLAEVGVNLNLEISEWGTFINRILTNAPDRAPTWYLGLNYYPAMDAEFIIQHFITTSPLQQFSDPTLDELYQQQAQEFDPQKRLETLQEFMAVSREDAPVIFLFQAPDVYATSPRVTGYTPTPDNYIHLDTVNIEE